MAAGAMYGQPPPNNMSQSILDLDTAALAVQVARTAAEVAQLKALVEALRKELRASIPLGLGIPQKDGSIATVSALVSPPGREPIRTAFSTGMREPSGLLYDGEPDPHYALIDGPAIVLSQSALPSLGSPNGGGGPTAISIAIDGRDRPSTDRCRTTFDATGFVDLQLHVEASAHDSGAMWLNGSPIGVISGFDPPAVVDIGPRGLDNGRNVLDFVVDNQNGITGLRVKLELTGRRL
jgi:hypothetical protein